MKKQAENTAWQRLQLAKAICAERENEIAAGKLVWVEDVERTTAETWQMVGNDLRHTLPMQVADRLTGMGIDPAVIRQTVRIVIDAMIRDWKTNADAETVVEAAHGRQRQAAEKKKRVPKRRRFTNEDMKP